MLSTKTFLDTAVSPHSSLQNCLSNCMGTSILPQIVDLHSGVRSRLWFGLFQVSNVVAWETFLCGFGFMFKSFVWKKKSLPSHSSLSNRSRFSGLFCILLNLSYSLPSQAFRTRACFREASLFMMSSRLPWTQMRHYCEFLCRHLVIKRKKPPRVTKEPSHPWQENNEMEKIPRGHPLGKSLRPVWNYCTAQDMNHQKMFPSCCGLGWLIRIVLSNWEKQTQQKVLSGKTAAGVVTWSRVQITKYLMLMLGFWMVWVFESWLQ